jgi:hypothetical protein
MPDDPFGTLKKFDAGAIARFRAEQKKKPPPEPPKAPEIAEPPKEGAPPAEAAKAAGTPAAQPPPPVKEPAASAPPPGATTAKESGLRPRPPLGALKVRPLAEALTMVQLSAEAKALVRPELTTVPFLHVLVQSKLYPDAIRLVAYSLPQREAIWWACRCTRTIAGKEPSPAVESALRAAEKWVADPSENNRWPAMPAAEEAGFGTPAGCSALATFWTGGSLSAPDLPPVPPAPDLTPRGVANAVLLAGLITEPEKTPERYFQFVTEGIKIAMGLSSWTQASPAPSGKPAKA